ncbi:uncharacterized protein LOC126687684 [Mercurialis annua]|uniref:uncharacterized protein LOC126687684 n=1 Tax=Mercurialis annua TaxID=3986 RepID=UPI00215F07C6|nr:uncharacterized protein LOC126687684 [Mercurialis annua]
MFSKKFTKEPMAAMSPTSLSVIIQSDNATAGLPCQETRPNWSKLVKNVRSTKMSTISQPPIKLLSSVPDHSWVEAEAVSKITASRVLKFFRRGIIYRFGIPKIVITDNGKQFDSKGFKDYYAYKGIDLRFTSVTHPQTNGMTKVTNRTIVNGLKKRLDDAKGGWAEELHNVLWSYQTTTKAGTGRTPYSLTYGCEALIPVEIGMPTLRVLYLDTEKNEENMKICLDML